MEEWIKKIFKREKPAVRMPKPKFQENWKQELYEENVKEGVLSLQEGKSVYIMDDGRGYELALEIKRNFLLEYQKRLAEKIRISHADTIIIEILSENSK